MKSKNFSTIFTFCFIFLNLILVDQAAYSQMFWNQTLSLAGSSTSYISVPNSSSINIIGSFSIEAWVNPSTLTGPSKGIISKGGSLGTSLKYALRITSGRVQLITNGSPRLSSKVNSLISANKWTHIAATYTIATGSFKIYLNGALDTSAVIGSAAPPVNTDSLYIGVTGASTPFAGQLDEIRLWNKELSAADINNFYRISLSENKGHYTGLVMSMTFQDENSEGTDFNTRDMTGNGNNGNPRNTSSFDNSNNPYSTIHPNLSFTFSGSNYLAAKDTSVFDASTALTLECWVYPTTLSAATYISKGSSASPVYFFGWNGTKLFAKINGTQITLSNGEITLNQWNHLAFTYNGSIGSYNFYINGEPKFAGISSSGNINNSSDSLYIGGGPGTLFELNGFIDEVRIIKDIFSFENDVRNRMHNSIDAANDPAAYNIICYNLDGSLIDNSNNGGPKLNMVNNGEFSYPASNVVTPISPIGRDESGSLSTGYYFSSPIKDIPTLGIIYDTIQVNEFKDINDVNLFLGINHFSMSQIEITLIAPDGDSIVFFDHTSVIAANTNISAVFDDQADSSLINGRYVTLANTIKPNSPLNTILAGKNSHGKWILKINDKVAGNGGTLYAWGMQFNNSIEHRVNFRVNNFIQGFYNPVAHIQIGDTMKILIANNVAPFNFIDSSVAILSPGGEGLYSLKQELLRTSFYVVLKHRNSLETWASSTTFLFDDERFYNFFDDIGRAYGDNQTQVEQNIFGIFSGDINRDGNINLADIILTSNASTNFATGYVNTDITGDNNTNLTDILIVFNNSNKFVSLIRP
ncbi:MAG: LamG-like jellyroll fold domain-containing protein [Ignavibacteria bacterium]